MKGSGDISEAQILPQVGKAAKLDRWDLSKALPRAEFRAPGGPFPQGLPLPP